MIGSGTRGRGTLPDRAPDLRGARQPAPRGGADRGGAACAAVPRRRDGGRRVVTGELADELAAARPWMHVLHRPRKEGLGRAYVAGFGWALERDYSHILEMDCDLSHPPAALPAMLEASRHADLVLGSRYVAGGGVEGWPASRRTISRGGCLYARTVLGVGFHDLTGGFKCFRRWVLASLDLSDVHAGGY